MAVANLRAYVDVCVCVCYWGRVILIVSAAEELNPLPELEKRVHTTDTIDVR